MKKRLFSFLSLALVCIATMAVPVKPGIYRTVKLADGTEVRVEARGDEFCHFWQAEDGRAFTEDAQTGVFRQVNLQQLIDKGMARRKASMAKTAKRLPMKVGGIQKSSDFVGKKKGLIVLVQFIDKKFEEGHDKALYEKAVNEENFTSDLGFRGSVHDYFMAQSYGQFDLNFDVVGPVTLPKSYSYYGYGGGTNSSRLYQFTTSVLDSIAGQVDFSKYDWNGDGEAEEVFFLYAGSGANYGARNTIWPHKFNISYMGDAPVYNGITIDTYACSCELNAEGSLDGIGTICHEFSHCLGYPDLYDSQYTGNYGTGAYDLMCSGNYNDDGFCPAGYTAYERMIAGWLEPIVLNRDTTVTDLAGLSEGGESYIIYNDGHPDEYFLIENRERKGWDAELPGDGLLITHIDYDKDVWDNNLVNSTVWGYNTHPRCQLIPAPVSYSTPRNIPFPYGTRDKLINGSNRYANLYNKNTDGTKYMNKPITEITKSDEGLISFKFENDMLEPADTASYKVPENYLFYESFNKNTGEGGNDGSYDRKVKADSLELLNDNNGWEAVTMVPGDKCLFVGSDTLPGRVVTPEIMLNGKENTLIFRAAPFKGKSYRMIVNVAEGDATLADTLFIIKKDSWATCRTKIKGDGKVRLAFRVATGDFYLDEVCITDDNTSGIQDNTASAARPATGRIYSLDGRYVGNSLSFLRPGIYIVDGKKVVRK